LASQPPNNVWDADRVIYPILSQYALYFVYLGLVICVSSYAGELVVFPIHTLLSPGASAPYDSPTKLLSFAVFSDSPRLFSCTVTRNRVLFAK
jgi:hypothetical protein